MKLKFTNWVMGCTLLTLLAPTILHAQTPEYGTTRRPRTCPSRVEPRTGAISVEQAKMYFMCGREKETDFYGRLATNYLMLVSDLTIQVAPKPRPFNFSTDGRYLGIDTELPVYDIRGSFTTYFCSNRSSDIGKNCLAHQNYIQQGICYRNTFGDWYCNMTGKRKMIGQYLPPPTN